MTIAQVAHTAGTRRGTKRWNIVGSVHAKQRMQELRDRKASLAATEAAKEWTAAVGVPFDSGWLKAAVAAGYPHGTGLTSEQKRAWFKHAAAEARANG